VTEGPEPGQGATLALVREGVEWREIDGEITLLDMRASEYIALNRAGSLLWTSLAEGATRDHLVGMLVGRFGITAEQASTDVDAFLQDLAGRGFLQS
jgi:coenzyme PQQ synthesis protein D (PqqD)